MASPPVVPGLSPLGLAGSVGLGGKNLKADVIRIQDTLNAIPAAEGTPARLLSLDGIAGPKTCEAIRQFQLKHFGFRGADGRVDPGGQSERRLGELLATHGSSQWSIRRVEAAAAAHTNVAGVRTTRSRDRFFEIADGRGQQRALYFFLPPEITTPPRAHEVPPLRDRFERNPFQTIRPCGVFSFIGLGSYTEVSDTPDRARITIRVRPLASHVTGTGELSLQVQHQWLQPSSEPGVRIDLNGILAFVRDQGSGPKKTGKQ